MSGIKERGEVRRVRERGLKGGAVKQEGQSEVFQKHWDNGNGLQLDGGKREKHNELTQEEEEERAGNIVSRLTRSGVYVRSPIYLWLFDWTVD